jgi:hypothetical protein
VLIGVYDLATGKPLMGVVGRPFSPSTKVKQGVGPSTTLGWPDRKQSDIAVEVDTARLETSQFKKCCVNCVLIYYPSTEFKSSFDVF